MLLQTRGKAFGISEPLVLRVTRNANLYGDHDALLIDDVSCGANQSRFRAVISCLPDIAHVCGVHSMRSTSHLSEGDVVVLYSDGMVQTLYRPASLQNFLFTTDRCNSNCLMCSQPPRDKDDVQLHYRVNSQLIPLIPQDCPELGITGGEPTLTGNYFFLLLSLIRHHLPLTEIHCLTNGRTFAHRSMADRLGSMQMKRLMLGVPLYGDHAALHDYVVQARDAFTQTMRGLYNLALHDVRLEIRVVLHRQTVPRLPRLAEFIYRNLPFVEHVTFMGLENQGYTPHNRELLWMDPVDYADILHESVEILSSRGMNASVYNSQLCTLPTQLHKYARRSISDWKNIYLPICSGCDVREECSGFFMSSLSMHSAHIKPIQVAHFTTEPLVAKGDGVPVRADH